MNAMPRPARPRVPPLSDALPRHITGPGITLVIRPAACPVETRLELAAYLLAGTGHTITEGSATCPNS